MSSAILNVRSRSLLRANVLVLGSLLAAFVISHFAHERKSLLLAVPAVLSLVGTADTLRCISLRWSFYHAGVVLCLYMDIMAMTMVFFLFLYPYMQWIQ